MNNLQKPLSEEQKANLHELGKNKDDHLSYKRFETLSGPYSPQVR